MIFKKNKAIIAAIMAAAVVSSSMLPCVASAAGSRTKKEAFGDDTYANRFLSLYDDVITNGQENGYLSKDNVASGGFGVPYHAPETVIVEAPDYGHETTSEAMSYIVWVAAMKDNLSKKAGTASSDMAKAWKTMEIMIPETQTGFWNKELSAQYADEEPLDPKKYPVQQDANNTGKNPIHKYFSSAYSDTGEYLMHWLADVDNWYGYGGTGNKFTFINTFQRGNEESCFETIPHPAIENLEYGNPTQGIKGVFSTETTMTAQWSYTNAPDAEDRAIQAVYAANRWGVGDSNLTTLAGKMGDELRNNMFDKYYKAIGCQSKTSPSTEYDSCHYLMSWYTSWGGAKDGMWAWQIGCSHSHQFYQNPLAAYGLLYDKGLNSAMKATNATKDYTTSLQRQMEFYLWLQSADGPIAGGATNSWMGKYEKYPSDVPTFYKMAYTEHPVYADPGSNHWIGNQVWAMQRLAELYYVIKTDGDKSSIKPGGLSMEEALKTILDRWVDWFVDEVELTSDGDYSIPATLDWSGKPASWSGTYSATANAGLTCSVRDRGNADSGCITSLANTLIYYAAAEGVKASDISGSTTGSKALYIGKELLDRVWEKGRDDIGITRLEHNGSLKRIFDQEVWVPTSYTGTMPNGDEIKNGIKFIDIRTMYRKEAKLQELEAAFKESGSTEDVDLYYHRFWHMGDVMMALGAMAELYPDMTPGGSSSVTLELSKSEVEVEVGKSATVTANVDVTWKSDKTSVATVDANGKITGVAAGTATITATDANGNTATVTVTVTGSSVKAKYGDVNCDGSITISDLVLMARYVAEDDDMKPLTAQGILNADCAYDGKVNSSDITALARYLAHIITEAELGPQA